MDREAIKKVSRIVIKLGSSILTNDGTGLDQNLQIAFVIKFLKCKILGKKL